MKYFSILFVLLAFNGFAQKEIFLQTNPGDSYVISYTTNSYVMLFPYQDVLDGIKDLELKNAVKIYLDSKLAAQETVEINIAGQTIIAGMEEYDLKELMEWRIFGNLLHTGNVMILDPSGKPSVGSIIHKRETNEKGHLTSYTDAKTGQNIYVGERKFRTTGTPSF